jgi:hypothetical protein
VVARLDAQQHTLNNFLRSARSIGTAANCNQRTGVIFYEARQVPRRFVSASAGRLVCNDFNRAQLEVVARIAPGDLVVRLVVEHRPGH